MKDNNSFKVIAKNPKAKFNYDIEETFEVGIVLLGSEVKSLRSGKATITEAYADIKDGEMFLINSYISEYKEAGRFNHEPRRIRKLLLHKKQINKLIGKTKIKGYSIIPLSLYFNRKNTAKLSVGLGKGKKLYDKREAEKQKDWQRSQARDIKYED